MKKTPLIACLALLPVTIIPLTLVTRCACAGEDEKEKEKTLIEKIKEQAINEFITLNKYPRRTGYTYPVYKYLAENVFPSLGYKVTSKNNVDDYLGMGYTPTSQVDDNKKTNGNFWIDIATSAEYSKVPKIAIQVPMDMVLTASTDQDYDNAVKNGIEVVKTKIDNSNVLISKDNKTSLGKNGLMIGLLIAILKNKEVKHGPLRLIFTTDSENTMLGSKKLGAGLYNPDPKYKEVTPALKNIYALINLGGNVDNGIVVSSPANWKDRFVNISLSSDIPKFKKYFKIKISGLSCASEFELNETRPNINKLLGQLLDTLNNKTQQIVELCSYKTNAKLDEQKNIPEQNHLMPTGADIEFAAGMDIAELETKIGRFKDWIKTKYPSETNVEVVYEKLDSLSVNRVISTTNTTHIANFINNFSEGIYSKKDDETVESSQMLSNIDLDITRTASEEGDKQLIITTSIRSSNVQKIDEIRLENEILGQQTLKKITSTMFGDRNYNYAYAENASDTKPYVSSLWAVNDPTNDKLVKLAVDGIKNAKAEPNIVNSFADDECQALAQLPYTLPDDRKIQFISLGCRVDNLYKPNETIYTDNLDKLIEALFNIMHNYSL